MKRQNWIPDGPEVARLRRVRRQLERGFANAQAFWDHFEKLDRRHRAAKRKRETKALARVS